MDSLAPTIQPHHTQHTHPYLMGSLAHTILHHHTQHTHPYLIDSLAPTIQPQHTQHSYPQHTTHLSLGHGYSLSHPRAVTALPPDTP